MQRLLTTALSAAMAAAEIVEFTEETIPYELIEKVEFAVINFYDNSETSKAINMVFEQAHDKFKGLEEAGEIVARDVGWFRCNIEELPQLKMEEVDKPNQVITGHRLSRNLNFLSLQDTIENEANQMAAIVFDMSGNWIEPLMCDDIMAAERKAQMQVVYFGSIETLADGPNGHMAFLKSASMIDRYEFFRDKPTFHVVEDPACAQKYGFDPELQNVALFIPQQEKPWVISGNANKEGEGLDMMQVMRFINMSIVKSIPKWGERAHTVLFDFQANALIFMIPEVPNNDPRELMKDWRALTFNQIVEATKEFETGLVPIMSTFEAKNIGGIMQLSELMKVKKEDLPQFYVKSGRTGKSVPYPFPLDDPLDAKPEMILLWGRKTTLEIEIEAFDGIVKQIEDKEDITAEEKEQYKAEMLKVKVAAEEEMKVVQSEFEKVVKMVEEEKQSRNEGQGQQETSKEEEQAEHIEL